MKATGSQRTTRQAALLAVLCLLLLASGETAAQQTAPADTLSAAAGDTLATTPADSSAVPGVNRDLRSGLSAATMAASQSANSRSVSLSSQPDVPFFIKLDNSIKSGTRADVRVNKYYAELGNDLVMAESSKFTNTLKWSWDDFRQQDKTVESRSERFVYTAGNLLPVKLAASGSWDWSEDNTINSAGFENLSKRDFKTGSVKLTKPKFDIAGMKAILNTSVGLNNQQSLNRDQRNDFKESYLDGGAQLGGELAQGLNVASRIYGKSVGGDRTLGDNEAPSTANGDTVAVGIYFDRRFATGRLTIARSNFDKKYLDYKRNSTGQIDTVGLDEFDKVIDELETNDAVSLEFENELELGRLGFITKLSRDTDELAYQASGVGSKERLTDEARFGLTFGTRRDSFALNYTYLWKWDDQRIKNATANRGRQYTKNRDLDFYYGRRLFRDTRLSFKVHQGLGQAIAQNEFNNNDKDRLRNDLSIELSRNWPDKFRVDLLFSYKKDEEYAIRETSSANNNIKDSYEVSPGFNWPLADWLVLSQSYRIYIQYTDYIYSDLEEINREDDYNKRGVLNTIVVIRPTKRLELAVRHDYNKRSSAVKTLTDATGTIRYYTEQKQAINKIDLGATYEVTEGVTLEAATFRTRDYKETYGTTVRETEVFKGEIWIGAKVSRSWGQTNPLQLSAMVKKYNAFGPSVTEASSDYWEADVWLKWEF